MKSYVITNNHSVDGLHHHHQDGGMHFQDMLWFTFTHRDPNLRACINHLADTVLQCSLIKSLTSINFFLKKDFY